MCKVDFRNCNRPGKEGALAKKDAPMGRRVRKPERRGWNPYEERIPIGIRGP